MNIQDSYSEEDPYPPVRQNELVVISAANWVPKPKIGVLILPCLFGILIDALVAPAGSFSRPKKGRGEKKDNRL